MNGSLSWEQMNPLDRWAFGLMCDFYADGGKTPTGAADSAPALDYKGQPREANGRFTFGKLNGKSSGALKRPAARSTMSMAEARRVSSGILTDHPRWKPGEIHSYEYGLYRYRIVVKGPGSYRFIHRKRLK